MEKILVVGSGTTGLTAAGILNSQGHETTLLPHPIIDNDGPPWETMEGPLKVDIKRGNDTKTYTVPALIIPSGRNSVEKIKEYNTILIAVSAQYHPEVAEYLVPHLHPEQTIVITPGNLGSLVFFKDYVRYNKLSSFRDIDIPHFLEIESNIYVTKRTGPLSTELVLPPRARFVAAFPGNRTEEGIKRVSHIFPFKPSSSVIETTLNLPNIDSHLPGMVLNTGCIESREDSFYFYRDGLTPGVLNCIDDLHREKEEVMKRYKAETRTSPELLHKIANEKEYPQFAPFRAIKGPKSMGHRFLHEDAYAGLAFLVSLADKAGISAPTAHSLLTLSSCINRYDYLGQGRTLENLEIPGETPEEIVHYFLHG